MTDLPGDSSEGDHTDPRATRPGLAAARRALAADRVRCLDRMAALERELAGIVEAAQAANADDEHDPEGATIAFEREHAAALLAQARAQLADIDAALDRVAADEYGICARCGRPIAQARLEARPASATCIDCASKSR